MSHLIIKLQDKLDVSYIMDIATVDLNSNTLVKQIIIAEL